MTVLHPCFHCHRRATCEIRDRWRNSFDAFFSDMGPRPTSKHSLDRVDVNGNYEPGNCRWADLKTQARNKRRHCFVTYNDRTMPLSEACELSGTHYPAALYRIKTGRAWNDPAKRNAKTQKMEPVS